jgi:hypothetical protein
MLQLERGVHVLSNEFGFGYIDGQQADRFVVKWDSGQVCTLSRQQIEDNLEVVGLLPLSATPLESSEVYYVDFKQRKLLKKELFIY